MISRLEFLFPAQPPNPTSPEYWKMIREIGVVFIVGLLLLVPVVLLGVMGLRDLIRGRKPMVWGIAAVMLVLSAVGFLISRNLEQPLRPYRLAAAEYSNYTVVEARVIRLGAVVTVRPSYDKHRKVQRQSAAPFPKGHLSGGAPERRGLRGPRSVRAASAPVSGHKAGRALTAATRRSG